MRYYRLSALVMIAFNCMAVQTPYIIYFMVHEYPQVDLELNTRPGAIVLEPGRLHVKIAEHRLRKLTSVGVIALFNGFIDFSDNDGKIVFPRTTQQEFFHLVITHDIEVVYAVGNTVQELRVPAKEAYSMYTIERIYDQETGATLWDVKAAELPEQRTIRLHAIVVLAKPENIYVPVGATFSNNQPNLHLPSIYAKPRLDHFDNALFVMNIKQYLAPIRRLYQKESQGYVEITTTDSAAGA